MSDTTTPAAPAPAPDLQGLSQDQINQLLASLHLGQGLPNVQPDRTPVDSSGFGGGLRRVVSLLGEFAGSPGPETLKALSPAEREQAGIQALSRFGTGLLQASGSGQWIGTNLGNAFAHAERGYDTTTKQALGALAARQGYAVEDQRAQIERLKAALPLLSLQAQTQAAAEARRIAAGGTVAPGASIATGGSISVPPDYLPFYQEASARTGIPVDVLIAQGKQEGNFDPAATGKAGEIGIHQILPATAKSPGFGMTGVDPATLRDPRANINFAADYLKARLPKDANPNDPAAVMAALKGYNGGGDPDYVNHVLRYVPGARAALAPPPAPGQATVPPAAVAPRPSLPPPEAPLAGTAQTAGPAVPTGNVIPPSPPGSPAAVADIIEGMVARGADPTTLAPGRGSAPAPMPGAVVMAQAGSQGPPPIVNPYGPDWKPTDIPIPNLPRYDPNLTPAQNASFDKQRAVAGLGPPGEVPAKLAAVEKARADAIAAKQKDALDAADVYRKEQADRQRTIAKDLYDTQVARENKAQEQENARQAAEKLQQDELARINATGEQTRSTNRDQVKNNASQKLQEDMNKETLAARDRIGSLEAVLELSRNVQNPTLLANKTVGGTPVVDLIKALGIGTESLQNRAGAIQALRSGIANVTKAMRQGVALGNASDADLRFITALGPSEMEDDATREAIVANLLGQQHRQMRFGIEVSKMLSKGVDIGEAIDAVDKKIPPVTPVIPKELADAPRGDPRVAEWFSDNVPVNTIWSDEKGKRHILHSPDWKPPGGRQQP